jgi:hypothetical protein
LDLAREAPVFPYWNLDLDEIARRMALEKALADYVPPDREALSRAFLSGLSVDELLFLAEFLGSCILISSAIRMDTWDAIGHEARAFRRSREQREDADHKLILLSEFAACCGFVIKYR